ncbi:MAG: hypothetical protein M3Y07_19140, partial [Acidobacteriota bacterium]|nr:hypothetical protein [Acidobacteriota bacterium]
MPLPRKEPEQRFQSAADLAFALESLTGSATEIHRGVGQTSSAANRPRKGLYRTAAVLAGVAALLATYYVAHRSARPPAFAQFRRLTFRQGLIANARFTGDGKGLAYDAAWDGNFNRIYSCTLGIPEPRELDLPKGDALMALSSRGELALSLGPWNLLDGGLLGRS